MTGNGNKKISIYLNNLTKWIDSRLPVFTFIQHELAGNPTPKNLNYWWNFGSLAGITLCLMMVSGIWLAMYYTPHVDYAFNSVERIMRDVNGGWFLRYLHMNGASMFFIVVYTHIIRGLYYGSYKKPRELLWIIGVLIFLLMMGTAFMGYVLPWGQMSFWGATVITNLFSAIPIVGESIVELLWGGFSVDNPTLNRFFSLHYLFPFLIVGAVMLHIVALHMHGSNNPTGIEAKGSDEKIPFHPYYTSKDLFGLAVFLLVWMVIVFFAPNFFAEPDNYIPANPLSTPAHIVPEWYFLPFYAILRSIPDKLGGVLMMFASVSILFVVPWLDRSPIRSATFRPIYKYCFVFFILTCLLLGWAGGQPAEGLALLISRVATAYYFAFFLVIMPVLTKFERALPLPITVAGVTRIKHIFFSVVLIFPLLINGALSNTSELKAVKQNWGFAGVIGKFDKNSLQRGFQVYKEVCSTCHSMSLLSYRNLEAIGYPKKIVKAFAKLASVQDGPNDEGEMFERDGVPSDSFESPFHQNL